MRFFTCLFTEHDLWLVALAALICTFGAWVTMRLCLRAQASDPAARASWIFLGSVAAGSTIWCTHFVAMLAYRPGVPVSYGPELTGLSLLVAITSTAISLSIACSRLKFRAEIAGALFGLGVAAMHYTGMAAFSTGGVILWDKSYVAASLLLSLMLGAGAFSALTRIKGGMAREGAGAVLLVAAIVALHFTAMAAVIIIPAVPNLGAMTSNDAYGALAIAVAGVGLLVLGTGLASYLLDQQSEMRARAHASQILESSVDGAVIETDDRIRDFNAAFARLYNAERSDIVGRPFAELISDPLLPAGRLIRSWLLMTDGQRIPVEITVRDDKDSERRTRVYSIRDLRQRLAQEARIFHLASFDTLTGLPNRTSFLEHLDEQIDTRWDNAKIALFSINLDRFKDVNDVHGHEAGDHVLSQLAGRLRMIAGDAAYVARLGGDEFAAVTTVMDREDAVVIAARLERALFAPIRYHETDLHCGAAIGVSFYPDDAASAAGLMSNADLAMYRAKGSHTDAICFYEEEMDERVRLRRAMARDLQTALKEGQFHLAYQPQFSAGTRTLTGYETLLRWRHPERESISPDQFIPIAEDTGLIVEIGEWILNTACAAAAAWKEKQKVAVNLSAVQLGNPDLPRRIHEALIRSGLSPARLEVEITETAVMHDAATTLHLLRQIKALGVSIALDDFGTGYSSLATLRAFPFDKIKLDKSFVDDIETAAQARAMLRAVLAMGESLAIPILAEGVETEAQLAFLAREGCAEVQGYLLGRPADKVLDETATPGAPMPELKTA